jgi:hypothetical protein
MKLIQISSDSFLDIQLDEKRKKCIKLVGLINLSKFESGGLSPTPALPILCLIIFDYWETWLKIVMVEHV